MKRIVTLVLLLFGAVISVLATPPHFEHIIIVIQENRTPDNLFGGNPTFESGVNIARAADAHPFTLAACFDPKHTHGAFKAQYNGGAYDSCASESRWRAARQCRTIVCKTPTSLIMM